MSKLKERILFMFLGGVLTLGVLLFVEWLQLRTPKAVAYTTVQLVAYRAATTNFFTTAGRWPESASELATNSLGIAFIYPSPPAFDGWGRQIVYEPYTTNAGYGRVVSYGRDGKPGGDRGGRRPRAEIPMSGVAATQTICLRFLSSQTGRPRRMNAKFLA